jgi:hypothetical protein
LLSRLEKQHIGLLIVFENWMLRRMYEPRNEEVTGKWTKVHNKELTLN